MTDNPAAPHEPEQTDVDVELPAKVTETTQVDATPETAGDTGPDEVTQNLEAEPKQE